MNTRMQNPSTPVHIEAMKTPFVSPIRYPWLLQAYDAVWYGRRDARPKLAHEPHDGRQPSASLRRLDAMLQERCEIERRYAVNIAASILDRRQYLMRSRTALLREREELDARIEEMAATSARPTGHVPKAESHLTEAQRSARRGREAAAQIAPLIADRTRVGDALTASALESADLEGRLSTLWESLQAKVTALAFHYERRCSTQVRGYLRRTPAGADHPLNTRAPLRPPTWATQPNPWLPAEAAEEGVS